MMKCLALTAQIRKTRRKMVDLMTMKTKRYDGTHGWWRRPDPVMMICFALTAQIRKIRRKMVDFMMMRTKSSTGSSSRSGFQMANKMNEIRTN